MICKREFLLYIGSYSFELIVGQVTPCWEYKETQAALRLVKFTDF